ncbi:putative glycerol-3-phosphate acyltransferase [Anaplasma phagocytophilum]|uniref:Glycerol-3-phosphate acyltransferase n=1 Tax=Anaplasma phagocytophilum TaxID=948 RepID=A0A098EG66_ANAPH|nr:glycerol-3-phosphate 1-O-acyltransferase PlsY [Anaplasma phagocytophilum]CEG20770.1 Glycerol-3-phosphate acyltransferase [Anaplasma phagocytophilum]SBO14635.1 putative glycerol-3-phosphate acyltransferase [Anaplasma phagocytophilum]
MFIVILIGAYLLGSIPFAYILTKLFTKKDIREVGSKNVGATNVFRVNKKLAGLVLLLDIAKSAVLVYSLQKYGIVITREELCIVGLLSVLGHIYPVWLKFKGGKGVATSIGVIIPLNTLMLCVFFITWLFTFNNTRYVSLSSIVSIIATMVVCYLTESNVVALLYSVQSVLVVLKHRENIVRLIKREEKKVI